MRARAWAGACLLLAGGTPHSTAGQEVTQAVLSGQVLLAGEPMPGAVVVLHRVSPDTAGEVDSLAAGVDGSFQFILPHVPDPANRSEVFFASVRHLGIVYFGRPITAAAQLDSSYLVQAYDTVTAPAGGTQLPIRVRNLFIEGDPPGWRATDLIQVGNDGDRTLLPAADGVTWTYPLPEGATEAQLGESDFSLDQVDLDQGTIRLSAPFPPGDRLLVVRYALAAVEGTIPFPGSTERAELLIREPAPPVEVLGLEQVPSVELEPGNTYRRYLAAGLTDATVRVGAASSPVRMPYEWLAVALALLLAGAGVVAFRSSWIAGRAAYAGAGPSSGSGTASSGGVREPGAERKRLLLEIARLDAEFEGEDPNPRDADRYRRKRKELVDRLRRESGP